MADLAITRRGAVNTGGAAGELTAAIGVVYPAGSICTCSNGTDTITAETPSGLCVFAVSLGKWTVTCEDPTGENGPKSETVEITKEGQFASVKLVYRFILFSAETGLADGYALSQGTVADGVINAGKDGNGRAVTFETPVDITDFSTLTVVFGTITGGSFLTFGLRDEYKEGYDSYTGAGYAVRIGGTASGSSPASFSETTHTLDLSSITGAKYVKLSTYQTSTCQIKSIIFST